MSSASCFPHGNRDLFIKLSYQLSKEDSERIVYFEKLPEELREESPLRVLEYLQRCGKASHSELLRILEGIHRHDVAQRIASTMSYDDNLVRTKQLAGALSAQIEQLMRVAEGTRDESNVKILADNMDQVNNVLKGLSTQVSPIQSSGSRYFPSDEELRRAHNRLRPRGKSIIIKSIILVIHNIIIILTGTVHPIEEAGDLAENIYDDPHKSAVCISSPPPIPQYYNYSAIRNQQAQQTTVAKPPSKKPTPPPKPQKNTKEYKHTGTTDLSSTRYMHLTIQNNYSIIYIFCFRRRH